MICRYIIYAKNIAELEIAEISPERNRSDKPYMYHGRDNPDFRIIIIIVNNLNCHHFVVATKLTYYPAISLSCPIIEGIEIDKFLIQFLKTERDAADFLSFVNYSKFLDKMLAFVSNIFTEEKV